MRKRTENGKITLCSFSIFIAFLIPGAGSLYAQNFPTKPITIVIPFGPGGQSDLIMRMMSPFAPAALGQPMVLRSEAGGAGAIASNEVAQSKPDGYTLLSGHANCNSVLPAVTGRSKGPGELEPVCRITSFYAVYFVRADAPWKNFKEVIAWAKANPGQFVFGNAGTWSSNDLSWRWLEVKAGFTSRNVPYDGGAELTTALLGGHTSMSRLSYGPTIQLWRAGKIRPLAIEGSERLPDMPEVPSMVELGYDMKGLGSAWVGIFAPKGTPRPVVDKLALGFRKIMENKQAVEGMKKLGNNFAYEGPVEFGKSWAEEFAQYKELVKIFKK